MKKQYEAPKAEMMEFDYEENVVASQGYDSTDSGNLETINKKGDNGHGRGCGKK